VRAPVIMRSSTAAAAADSPPGRRPSVVIADGSAAFADRLVKDFCSEGWDAVARHNLDEALTGVRRDPPDLVVTELAFGSVCGMEVLDRWTQLIDVARIAVVTGIGDVAWAMAAVRLGVCAFCTKPATASEVLAESRGEATQLQGALNLEQARLAYLAAMVEGAPSVHAASRYLGVERRSLRRMMARLGRRTAGTRAA
jgi:ActR/RegA family two-component response regulator